MFNTEEALRELLSTSGTVVKLEMRPPKQQAKRLTAMAEMAMEKEVSNKQTNVHSCAVGFSSYLPLPQLSALWLQPQISLLEASLGVKIAHTLSLF